MERNEFVQSSAPLEKLTKYDVRKPLIVGAMVLAASAADGADIKLGKDSSGRGVISLEGHIVGGDIVKVERLPQARHIVLWIF